MKLEIDKLEIGRLLNYTIDPYNAYKLSKRELKEISKHLEERFEEGYKLLNNFQNHILANNYGPNLNNIKIENRYNLLENLMKKRPTRMISKLKKSYRIYHKGEQAHNRIQLMKRTEKENKYIELCLYTHNWRQIIEKKNSKKDKHFYDLLKNEKFSKSNLLIQENPNQHYNFHSIFQRQKSKNSIIEKLTSKTLADMKTLEIYPERFYKINYNMRDFFGIRICVPKLDKTMRQKLNELITYEGQLETHFPNNNKEWISTQKVDHTINKKISINHIKHYLRTINYPSDPILEVQFYTLEDLLLDEFFTASGHLLKERKRKRKIKKSKNNKSKKIKNRIKNRLEDVLNFLP
jgi:hypothetical protein